MLKVGSTAPSFSGKDQHGVELSLESLTAKGHVVLYFYPKDFTPGCTIEACSFRDAYDELAAEGVTVVEEKEATRDHTERMLRAFGVEVGVENAPFLAQIESLRGGSTFRRFKHRRKDLITTRHHW